MGTYSVEGVSGVERVDVSSEGTNAFVQAFPGLYRLSYRVAYRLLGSDADAQEVAAEALTRAYGRWSRVSDHAEPWVATVATNLALDRARRASRARIHQRDLTISEHQDDPHSELRLHLQEVLRTLPKRQRQVVALRYLLDMSEDQVAVALGISVGTVKTHASRGLARAKSLLEEPS